MRRVSGTTDDRLGQVLAGYAGMVDQVISDPRRWLGLDEDPPPHAPFPIRAVDALRNRALGKTTPASPLWPQLPIDYRVQWWMTRIGISADLAGATSTATVAPADRIPLKVPLGAAAAGLAVCATAREHGQAAPQDWVPLLGRVLFDRGLPPADLAIPSPAESDQRLATVPSKAGLPPAGRHSESDGARRAATTLRQLARTFADLHDLLDPPSSRGSIFARGVAKLPAVGAARGWPDGRGGIGRAARETAQLIEKNRAS